MLFNPFFLSKNSCDQFKELNALFKSDVKLFKLFAGPFIMLATSDPVIIDQILSRPDIMDKGFFYKFIGSDFGLFAAECK